MDFRHLKCLLKLIIQSYWKTPHPITGYGAFNALKSLKDARLCLVLWQETFLKKVLETPKIFNKKRRLLGQIQNTAFAFRTHLQELTCRQFFSSPGYPYNNSVCESFFWNLKKETIYHHLYDSSANLAAVLDEYIVFYNNECPHGTLQTKTQSQIESVLYPAGKIK